MDSSEVKNQSKKKMHRQVTPLRSVPPNGGNIIKFLVTLPLNIQSKQRMGEISRALFFRKGDSAKGQVSEMRYLQESASHSPLFPVKSHLEKRPSTGSATI